MFGSKILDVAIGLVFVYIVVSIFCTAIREGIEAWLKTRAVFLEHGIRSLLQDKKGTGLAAQLFNHPLVFGLFTAEKYVPGSTEEKPSLRKRGEGLPSYIPSKTFATALLDIAAHGPDGASSDAHAAPISLATIRSNVANIGNTAVQRVLLTAVDTAQDDLQKAQKAIEDWYDAGMDRVSGWYKRSTQQILLVIGLVIAVGMNIDSVTIVKNLYKTDATREAAVAAAGNASPKMSYDDAKKALDNLDLPIGWPRTELAKPPEITASWIGTWFVALLGWFLTAVAATLGAPFWFDVLNKVMVIRSTVKPHEKSPEEGSEDRQPATPSVVVNTTPAAAQAPSG